MSNLSVVDITKRVVAAVEKGDKVVDQTAFAKLQRQLACEQFPNDSEGVALQKFYATPHGAEMLNCGLRRNYEAVQRTNSLGAHVPLAKGYGNPTPAWTATSERQSAFENPDVTRLDDSPRVFAEAVELLMKDRNISRDAAISEIYRAEKRRKGLSY